MRYLLAILSLTLASFAPSPQATITVNTPDDGGATWTTANAIDFNINFVGAGYAFVEWDDSLELWWRFEETGWIRDWSGNGHHGQNATGATSTSDYGKALDCNGGTNYASTHTDYSLDGTFFHFRKDEDITVAFWSKNPTNSGKHQDYFKFIGVGKTLRAYKHSGGINTYIQMTDQYRALEAGETEYFAIAQDAENGDDTWHHVAFVFRKPLTILMYIDGSLAETKDMSGGYNIDMTEWLNMASLTVGYTSGAGNDGEIDEFMVFRRELAAEEIEALSGIALNNLTFSTSVNELDQHNWKVHHVGSDNVHTSTAVVSTLVDGTNTQPEVTLLSPTSNSKLTGRDAILRFRAKSTENGFGLSQATIQWGRGSLTESTVVTLSGNQTEYGHRIRNLWPDTNYVWNVTVEDEDGNSGAAAANGAFTTTGQNNYYVSPNGDDSDPGTKAQPFATIQQFADVCKAGDTCWVREGNYRETVTITTSGTRLQPIQIKALPNHSPVINGCDFLDTFLFHSGNIYKALFPGDLGRGLNQVFEDGTNLPEATFPNRAGLWEDARSDYQLTGGAGWTSANDGTSHTWIDTVNLTQVDDYWNGATLHYVFQPRYHAATALVTDFDQGTNTLTATLDCDSSGSVGDWFYSRYYLVGVVNCIDQAGEWAVEGGELYMWSSDGADPDTHAIEVKQRQTGLSIDADYVYVDGIDVRACNIELSEDSDYCRLENVVGTYLSKYSVIDHDGTTTGNKGVTNTGVVMRGTYNVLKDCTLSYSSGNLVTLMGERNRVEGTLNDDGEYNCTLQYANQMATEAACICLGRYGSLGNVVDTVQMSYANRACVNVTGGVDSLVTNCESFQAGYCGWTWDSGPIYASNTDRMTIEKSLWYDCKGFYGIYLDNACWNGTVTQNVLRGEEGKPEGYSGFYNDIAILINIDCGGMTVQHNTLQEEDIQYNTSDTPLRGWSIQNNICASVRQDTYSTRTFEADEGIESNNIEWDTLTAQQKLDLFNDAAANDLTLGASSAAIDYGTELNFTTDKAGNAMPVNGTPDAGAYEYQEN